jgi:hypothetical protein
MGRYSEPHRDAAATRRPGERADDGPGLRAPPALPRELKLLARAWEGGGLHRVDAADVAWVPRKGGARPVAQDVPGRYASLRSFVEALSVDVDVPAKDLVAWTPKAVPWIANRIERSAMAFTETRPQGFFIGVVDAVLSPHEIVADGGTIQVPGRLSRFGEPATEGPYACLGVVAKAAPDARADLLSAGVWPIYSKGLPLPVRSPQERDALTLLLDQLRWWAEARQTQVVLAKPMRPVRVGSHDLLPGVVLERPDGRLVVVEVECEAAGARRSPDQLLMASLPGVMAVLTYSPGTDDPMQFRRVMTAAVLR